MMSTSVLATMAQEQQTQPLMPGEKPKPTKYVAVEEQKEHLVFFQGFTLSVDGYGPVAMMVSDYGTLEGALRLNLKNTFFPIIEAGVGKCSKDDFNTKVSYKTRAPFGRIGIDFNLMKNKHDENRIYGGVRYAYTNYKFDLFCPGVTDPIWGESAEFKAKDVSCYYHWMEIVFGIDAKIYGPVRLGWSARYKRRLFHNDGGYGRPWYVPGYGKQGNMRLGGTFNIIIEF